MKTITIKVKIGYKVAWGHQPHVTGTGAHGDKRTKRNRTRTAQNNTAIREAS